MVSKPSGTTPMRFSLQDIKKHIQRRNGELFVALHFLKPGEARDEIARLISYYEGRLGQPRRQFAMDEARACIADYRLAHCLTSTLSAWYSWQTCAWSDALARLTVEARTSLAEIHSPVQLRLALFSYVNTYHHGFLDGQTRAGALQTFAHSYQLEVADLEYLLALDSDEEAVLVRETSEYPAPPTPQEVATRYNQWAFEAALFNASSVH